MPEPSELAVRKVADEVWIQIQDEIENTDVSVAKIAKSHGVPLSTVMSRATRHGWLETRDLYNLRNAESNLKRIIKEISTQVNDMHQHGVAMLEALQYSHRIKITVDDGGNLHYVNFDDWADKPDDWDTMSDPERESHRRYISPPRLKSFKTDLMEVLMMKANIITVVTKLSKGSLPKIDVVALDLQRRDTSDKVNDKSNIFAGQPGVGNHSAPLDVKAIMSDKVERPEARASNGRKIKTIDQIMEEMKDE